MKKKILDDMQIGILGGYLVVGIVSLFIELKPISLLLSIPILAIIFYFCNKLGEHDGHRRNKTN